MCFHIFCPSYRTLYRSRVQPDRAATHTQLTPLSCGYASFIPKTTPKGRTAFWQSSRHRSAISEGLQGTQAGHVHGASGKGSAKKLPNKPFWQAWRYWAASCFKVWPTQSTGTLLKRKKKRTFVFKETPQSEASS